MTDQAIIGLHVGDDPVRHGSLVKSIHTLLADLLQSPGQVGLFQGVTYRVPAAVFAKEKPAGLCIHQQALLAAAELEIQCKGDWEAIAGQLYGRLYHLLQVHRAVLFEGVDKAGHRAGNASGLVAEIFAHARHFALVVEKQLAVGGSRGHFPVINNRLFVFLGEVNQHESTTTDITGTGVGYRQGEAGSDSGVHCIATLAQNAGANFGGKLFRARHHALAGDHGQEAVLEVEDGFLTLGGGKPDNQEQYSEAYQFQCDGLKRGSSPGLCQKSSRHWRNCSSAGDLSSPVLWPEGKCRRLFACALRA